MKLKREVTLEWEFDQNGPETYIQAVLPNGPKFRLNTLRVFADDRTPTCLVSVSLWCSGPWTVSMAEDLEGWARKHNFQMARMDGSGALLEAKLGRGSFRKKIFDVAMAMFEILRIPVDVAILKRMHVRDETYVRRGAKWVTFHEDFTRDLYRMFERRIQASATAA